jgi:hypothetical protein
MAPTSSSFRILVAAAAAALLAPSAARAALTDAQKAAPAKDPVVLAAPKDFAAAVDAIEKATGVKGEKLPFGETPLAEGRSFSLDNTLAERLLEGSHAVYKKAGFYLFRYERSYGMAGEKDRLGLLKTPDHRAVVRRVGTGSGHKGLGSETVVTWLDRLAKDEPFELWEVGTDYVAGYFVNTPKDPVAVAKRCAEFAPDLVAGRVSTLDLLAAEIKDNRTLYLIW